MSSVFILEYYDVTWWKVCVCCIIVVVWYMVVMIESYNNILYASQWPNGKILDTWDIIEAKFYWTPFQLISIFDDENKELKLYNTKSKLAHHVESLSGLISWLFVSQQIDILNKLSANIANVLVASDKRVIKTKLIQTFNFDYKILHSSPSNFMSLQDFTIDTLYQSNITATRNSSWQLYIKNWRNEIFLSQLINWRHICWHYTLCFDNLTYIITEYRDENGTLSYYFNAAAIKSQYLYNWKEFWYFVSLTGRHVNKNTYTLFQYIGYMPHTKEFVWGYLNNSDNDVYRFLPFDSSDQMTHQELSNPWDHEIIWLTQQHPDLSKNSWDVSFA